MTTKTQTMACTGSGSSNLERVKYFPRQLLTPADMIQEQEYFRNKLRRHNRLLHGWGVVCGAQVCKGKGSCDVIVKPGYVLGPYGDEIVIDREVHLGLRSWQSDCPDEVDWCVEPRPECPQSGTVYVAVRYVECVSHPVRVYTDVCGCGDKGCEHTRIRDSFEIKALTEPPDSLSDGPGCGPNHLPRLCGDCPQCPQDPWVVLATVTLTLNGISVIQPCHRRHVVTFADCFVRCTWPTGRIMSVKTNDAGETNGGEGRIVRVASTDTMGQPITLELPIHNVVFPTDFKSYIANHGQDVLHDSATGEEGLVQEIVALAGVEPDIVVENRGEFAAVLEGLTLRIDDLRAARKGLRDLLDQDGLDALDARYQGNPGAAANLPVKAIKGVGKHLAKVLGENATIAALAEKGFSEVLEAALKDVPENQKRRTERVLGKTYATALLIVRQGELYRKK